MGCFGSTDTWRELMACCLRSTRFILCLLIKKQMTTREPLLENYTNLSPEVILEVQHNTTFVLNHIICEATNTSSVKCLISRENARGSQDKITKELWDILTLCIILLMTQSCLKTSNIRSHDRFR
jgi:hypothetical protein